MDSEPQGEHRPTEIRTEDGGIKLLTLEESLFINGKLDFKPKVEYTFGSGENNYEYFIDRINNLSLRTTLSFMDLHDLAELSLDNHRDKNPEHFIHFWKIAYNNVVPIEWENPQAIKKDIDFVIREQNRMMSLLSKRDLEDPRLDIGTMPEYLITAGLIHPDPTVASKMGENFLLNLGQLVFLLGRADISSTNLRQVVRSQEELGQQEDVLLNAIYARNSVIERDSLTYDKKSKIL